MCNPLTLLAGSTQPVFLMLRTAWQSMPDYINSLACLLSSNAKRNASCKMWRLWRLEWKASLESHLSDRIVSVSVKCSFFRTSLMLINVYLAGLVRSCVDMNFKRYFLVGSATLQAATVSLVKLCCNLFAIYLCWRLCFISYFLSLFCFSLDCASTDW